MFRQFLYRCVCCLVLAAALLPAPATAQQWKQMDDPFEVRGQWSDEPGRG